MPNFNFYADSALTQPIDSGDPISFLFDAAGSADVQLWFGATIASKKVQDLTAPGSAAISITPTDANAGSGQPASAIKLATSQAGLTAATAGAALEIGATVLSGVGNAFPFWMRVTNALTAVGVYTDLSLVTSDLTETAV